VDRYDAFLAFSWDDRDIATQLAEALQGEGLDIWFAGSQLKAGDPLRRSLDRGLSRSRYGIVIFSPAFFRLQRYWTHYELDGIINSEVEGRKVLLPVWLDMTAERMRANMPSLAGRIAVHWSHGLDTVVRELTSVIRPVPKTRRRDTLERRVFDRLYHYGDATSPALRLVGASTESFAATDVLTRVRNDPYLIPAQYRDTRAELVGKLLEEADATHKMLFDGPAVRMLGYRVLVPDVHTEDKALQLTIAPLTYFDYAIVRRISDAAMEDDGADRIDQFVNIDSIASGANLSASSLSNIVDTATTVVTSDGYLLFGQRGSQVGDRGGWHTCAVAEGIQSSKDGIDFATEASNGELIGLPFRTVARGVAEELSPKLADILSSLGWALHLRLLGLSYDLEGFHPDLLFLLVVPLTQTEVRKICRESPGPDGPLEGALQSTFIGEGPFDIVRSLATTRWTPGGAASVIRCLEYLDAIAREQGLDSLQAAIDWLLRRSE
jgi:hypothetical protein